MRSTAFLAGLALAAAAGMAGAQASHPHAGHGPAAATDPREAVDFPDALRVQTLANMRDHLLAIDEITAALSAGEFDRAASVAEKRLGMTSLERHDASHVARFMPRGMQDIGSAMHRAASRFAVAAQDASASHDVKAALAALGPVMRQCTACHAAYRLR